VLAKDLLSIADFDASGLRRLLDDAAELKARRGRLPLDSRLAGKTLALVFQKPSLRTRVSFEVAMSELGGQSMYLSPQEIKLGERESVADVARVLSRYVHGIVARTFLHEDVVGLAAAASVPVINGLSDAEHPCQILADLLTLRERFGPLEGRSLAYVGDGNNVIGSLMLGAPLVGLGVRVATPRGYEPDRHVVLQAQDRAERYGTELRLLEDPREAVRGADAIYTDAWFSMGQEGERDVRRPIFAPYRVDQALVRTARPGAIVMHCLPAHRGDEIADDVLDGPQAVVFDQAENRLHVQKALLAALIGGERA
jgi:ornithine carbamoyltransferase